MRFLVSLLITVSLYAQANFFPLADIRPGMQGTGRTVFNGSRIEEFQVEILGVLENAGPRQSLILAKLSGGPLAATGIRGLLIGAVVIGPEADSLRAAVARYRDAWHQL